MGFCFAQSISCFFMNKMYLTKQWQLYNFLVCYSFTLDQISDFGHVTLCEMPVLNRVFSVAACQLGDSIAISQNRRT